MPTLPAACAHSSSNNPQATMLKRRVQVGRVTSWGIKDADSWLNNWPGRGYTNSPLLLDRNAPPNPAFDAVLNTARP